MPRTSNFHQTGSFEPWKRACNCILRILTVCFLLVACNQGLPIIKNPTITVIPLPLITSTSTSSPTSTLKPVPSPSPTHPPILVFLPGYLPGKLRSTFNLPNGYALSSTPEEADITILVGEEGSNPTIQWIYALVAPFPTTIDEVTTDDLLSVGKGDPIPEIKSPLLMDESTSQVLTRYWGTQYTQAIKVLPKDELLDYTWSHRPSLAIIPFEELEPRWKVLAVDGQSPIHKDFDPSEYPLNIKFSVSGNVKVRPDVLGIPSTNRDASRLTTLAMTGVTAMVRATAYAMEQEGITYPGEDIGALLAKADITHISNEIPFSPDCPYPESSMISLVFCSSPSYIELLKFVGADIIELTGDHFMDYGSDATLYTLEMYKDQGWPYYGGGSDAEDARQPVLIENNGNMLAFLGCNIGCQVKNEIPCDAIATDSHPGAAQCDFDWISSEISALRQEGYQVIFTFQHREYYTYTTEPILTADFGKVAAAGATIVSGSQAHQPHGFAFEDGSFIHYGLGNLFFDQFHYCPYYACDNAFIDQHVFYDGQYISTELITIHFIDFARPRLMIPEEREHFLETIFKASGW